MEVLGLPLELEEKGFSLSTGVKIYEIFACRLPAVISPLEEELLPKGKANTVKSSDMVQEYISVNNSK
jgi:hypothetical protein